MAEMPTQETAAKAVRDAAAVLNRAIRNGASLGITTQACITTTQVFGSSVPDIPFIDVETWTRV